MITNLTIIILYHETSRFISPDASPHLGLPLGIWGSLPGREWISSFCKQIHAGCPAEANHLRANSASECHYIHQIMGQQARQLEYLEYLEFLTSHVENEHSPSPSSRLTPRPSLRFPREAPWWYMRGFPWWYSKCWMVYYGKPWKTLFKLMIGWLPPWYWTSPCFILNFGPSWYRKIHSARLTAILNLQFIGRSWALWEGESGPGRGRPALKLCETRFDQLQHSKNH